VDNTNLRSEMNDLHPVLPYASHQVAGAGTRARLAAESQDIGRISFLVMLVGLYATEVNYQNKPPPAIIEGPTWD
jgi:hypothetical protein